MKREQPHLNKAHDDKYRSLEENADIWWSFGLSAGIMTLSLIVGLGIAGLGLDFLGNSIANIGQLISFGFFVRGVWLWISRLG